MSKEAYETYVVAIGVRSGARYADRHPLNIPLDLALGRLEGLSDLQLREALRDLQVETERRTTETQKHNEIASKCGGYDPFAALVRRQA